MQNPCQKSYSCSKDILKQYKVLQASFAEDVSVIVLNHPLFSVGCVIVTENIILGP